MSVKLKFNYDSITRGIKGIEKYELSLQRKTKRFCLELADVGIQTAQANTTKFGTMVFFSKRVESSDPNNPIVIMYGAKRGDIYSRWIVKDENGVETEKVALVNPLLMLEFGSGTRALNPRNVPGVGQGTFPGQTHAYDPQGWSWKTADGAWHHSYGISPDQPLFKAREEMYQQIQTIARRVFSNVV